MGLYANEKELPFPLTPYPVYQMPPSLPPPSRMVASVREPPPTTTFPSLPPSLFAPQTRLPPSPPFLPHASLPTTLPPPVYHIRKETSLPPPLPPPHTISSARKPPAPWAGTSRERRLKTGEYQNCLPALLV